MGRHPGIQFDYRIKELAGTIATVSVEIQVNFKVMRELETRAEETKKRISEGQEELTKLLALQDKMIHGTHISEFGIVAGMSKEDFEKATGKKITT